MKYLLSKDELKIVIQIIQKINITFNGGYYGYIKISD